MLLSVCILSSLLLTTYCVSPVNAGLTLNLTHIFNSDFPIYHSNLTLTEKIQRLGLQSKARATYLSRTSQENVTFPHTIRGHVEFQPNYIYMVQVGVGTFSRQNPRHIQYCLMLDTGTDLTWLQCEDCRSPGNHCFPQVEPLYPSSRSNTYLPIPCNDHQHCTSNKCKGKFCTYIVTYQDHAQSTGIIIQDTFTFASSSGRDREENLPLVFGCGFDQQYFDYITSTRSRMAGFLGLGVTRQYPSFVEQNRAKIDGRFSYCLPPMDNNGHVPSSLLRFGSDIPQTHNLHSIRMSTYLDSHGYFLHLKDLSLAGRRLNIPEKYFARGSNSRGCVIDSGSGFSHIAEHPFSILTEAMIEHFENKPGFQLGAELLGFNLCFERPESAGFRQLPRITFHFEGGDMEVEAEKLYYLGGRGHSYNFFCLAIYKATNGLNIIGARQQMDYRIIYDTQHMLLHFGPENRRLHA